MCVLFSTDYCSFFYCHINFVKVAGEIGKEHVLFNDVAKEFACSQYRDNSSPYNWYKPVSLYDEMCSCCADATVKLGE